MSDNCIKYKHLPLFITAVVFTAAIIFGIAFGQIAFKNLLLATFISIIAGLGGFIPIIYARLLNRVITENHALISASIRIVLAAAGAIITSSVTKINVAWFVGWLGLFYMLMLVFEISFIVQIIDRCEKI